MKNKIPPFVVLGAGGKATKCVSVRKIQGKNAYALDFLKLKDTANYDYGEKVKVEDIEGVYASLFFMKPESVDAVIKTLETIKKAMEDEE